MGIGPFTTYAPPGVYVRTVTDPVIGQLLSGLRIPVLIGTARETLSQTDFELVRGSSSAADTPIFNEDVSSRFVASGSAANPVLGAADGSRTKVRVRNFPIVDGEGAGKPTFDVSKVSVTVNGAKALVSAVDGPNGYVSLLVPPQPDDVVLLSYSFHRRDTRVTDDVSAQVTKGVAVLTAPKTEPYNIVAGTSDRLVLTIDDGSSPSSVLLTTGSARSATDVANDINVAAIPGLTASVHVDNQGLSHVSLIATGNILVGSGGAVGALGFNPGDYTARSKSFRVFNGPVVDGSDGGVTTTDPTKVVVLVNGAQVIAKAVDGANQKVTLPYAPRDGAVVTIQYYFNTFQDTFDYLPNSSIVSVGNVGIAPGRRDYLNGPDFTIVNEGSISKIQWGTAFQVLAGEKTGVGTFDSTQVVGLLVDDRMFGALCSRFTDAVANTVSTTKFVLPLSPRTGNGRDTPLGSTLFQNITNGRVDMPTNRPDLVEVHVGKTFRDAIARPSVPVMEVDSATNTFTLRDPVPADYKAFATFWYNRIQDDTYTLSVVSPGASGTGQYSVSSARTGKNLFETRMGLKSGLSQTVQWPSGVETVTDAHHTGDGTAVSETVTISFDSSLQPATVASFSNAKQEPYDIYQASRIFGGVIVDGNPSFSVDLSVAYKAQLLSSDVASSISFLSTDRLVLSIDGVILTAINLSSATSLADVATAINAAVDADTQVHPDGSGTFFSTAPNSLATTLSHGSSTVLSVHSRNTPSATNGLSSNVTVLSPTTAGQTNGATKAGLVSNQTASGSYNALNQAATMVGTKAGPFAVTLGVNDTLQLTVDGSDFSTQLPAGTAVDITDVVVAINDAYMSVASASDITQYTADLVTLANEIKSDYNTHRVSTVYHAAADSTNVVTSTNASDLATAITLLNEMRADYNAHLSQSGVHQLSDATNSVSSPAATTLQSAVTLAHELQDKYNAHLLQMGVHGHDDTTNATTSTAAIDLSTSIALVNEIKSDYNSHRTASGSHVTNDTTNIVTSADASDLATAITLANEIKGDFNAHLSQSGVHVTNDTTNAVSTANASDLTTLEALVNALKAAYNAHRSQTQGVYHVHGTNDLVNVVTSALSEIVAKTGLGINAGKLVLTSRVNTVVSSVAVKTTSSAADVLGLVLGATEFRKQPTAAAIAGALNAASAFSSLAVAYSVQAAGLGRYLRVDSRTAGSTSTLTFTSASNTAFTTDTGLGITPGTSGDSGENAVAGYSVSSSAGASGSSGTGVPGQTYTDARTGLRFTILPASASDYTSGGSFTITVLSTFVVDSAIPVRAIPGLEMTVFNTLNLGPGTTALVNTHPRSGAEPKIGDVYYASYDFAKTDLSTALFRDLKRIQQNFGSPTPDNPLSLAARLAILNGAILVGLKQVVRAPGASQATAQAFVDAIDEQRRPMSGNVKPDVISPMTTDQSIFAYLNQHCVFMSSPRQEGERMAFFGTAVGTSALGVQSIARGLNSELSIVTYPDSFVVTVTDDTGNSIDQLVDGTYSAAALAGTTCNPAIDVASPLTRRQIVGFKQTGRTLDPTEANQIAVAGVTILEPNDQGLRVRHGLTTRMDSVITRTPSVTMTIHYVQQTMRRVLDPFIGQKFSGALLKAAENAITGAFGNLIDQQIVTQVAGISVTVDEDDPTIMRTEAIYVPVFPLEYVVSTLSVRVRL